jgi:hypothetical protein
VITSSFSKSFPDISWSFVASSSSKVRTSSRTRRLFRSVPLLSASATSFEAQFWVLSSSSSFNNWEFLLLFSIESYLNDNDESRHSFSSSDFF